MLRKYVPGSGSSRRPTGGFAGFILRLILSLSLISGGFIAAAGFIREKIVATAGLYEAIGPYRGHIGILLLVIGLLCFLRAFFLYFAPLTDLLPQAMAVILGLMLGLEMMLSRKLSTAPEAGKAAEDEGAVDQARELLSDAVVKAQELLRKNREKIKALEQKQIPLGLTALVLGLIHLLAGGIWLL